MAAGNEAHSTLFNDYMRVKYQLEAQKERVVELRDELKDAREAAKVVIPPRLLEEDKPRAMARLSPEHPVIKIPPAPPVEEEEDYPDVRFWNKDEWNQYKERERNRNRKVSPLAFLCNESGKLASEDRIDEMTESAKLAWNELYYWRLDPATWMKKIGQAFEYFSNTMKTKYPEFRYCQGDWKLHAFATIRYPDWNRYYRKTGVLTRAKPSKGKRKADDEEDSAPKAKKKSRKQPTPPDMNVVDLDGDTDPAPGPSSSRSPPTSAASTSSVKSDSVPSTSPTTDATPASSPSHEPVSLGANAIANPSSTASQSPTLSTSSFGSLNSSGPPAQVNTGVTASTSSSSGDAMVPQPEGDHVNADNGMMTPTAGPDAPASPSTSSDGDNDITQPARPSRRPRIDPLAGLSIPKPPTEVPQTIPNAPMAVHAKPKKGKLMEPSETLLTARNLYAIDYLKTHSDVTISEFRDIYKKLDSETLKRYEDMSKERKAAAGKKPVPAQGIA
ncbi:hypothetical protein BDZ97DRAFT_2058235 [Flammula alnicola]|nr:hypothetical protein BDZ97DRAFT_2058235 [Flammula alnicola]